MNDFQALMARLRGLRDLTVSEIQQIRNTAVLGIIMIFAIFATAVACGDMWTAKFGIIGTMLIGASVILLWLAGRRSVAGVVTGTAVNSGNVVGGTIAYVQFVGAIITSVIAVGFMAIVIPVHNNPTMAMPVLTASAIGVGFYTLWMGGARWWPGVAFGTILAVVAIAIIGVVIPGWTEGFTTSFGTARLDGAARVGFNTNPTATLITSILVVMLAALTILAVYQRQIMGAGVALIALVLLVSHASGISGSTGAVDGKYVADLLDGREHPVTNLMYKVAGVLSSEPLNECNHHAAKGEADCQFVVRPGYMMGPVALAPFQGRWRIRILEQWPSDTGGCLVIHLEGVGPGFPYHGCLTSSPGWAKATSISFNSERATRRVRIFKG